MPSHKHIALILSLIFFKISSAQTPANNKAVVDYVNQYKDIAVFEMLRTHIPASIILAQGILESKNGTSRLAVEAHNHFGVKCKKTWTGKVLLEDDDDFQECFRFYETVFDSYQDHSNFLLSSSRYSYLFDLDVSDYKSWAYGLKEAGYATNPTYAFQLIDIIEKYNLYQYDRIVKTPTGMKDTTEKHAVTKTNGVESTTAKENDSYSRIAVENKMKVAELLGVNDLSEIKELHAGDVVYLKPKKTENKKYETHVVSTGESMHDIAQKYGIRLDVLLERNGLLPGEEPSKGETISINKQNKKPVKKRKTLKQGQTTVDMRVRMGERSQTDSIIEAKYNAENPEQNKLDTSIARLPPVPTDTANLYVGNISKYDSKESDDKPDEVINNELYHYVRKGETLFSISKKYNVTLEGLKDWNKIRNNYIQFSQKLRVSNHAMEESGSAKIFVADPGGFYIVQEGDSLSEIAEHFVLTPEELVAMNNMTLKDSLKVGDKLRVTKTETTGIYRPPFHVVKGGDTLQSIARKYEISVLEIKKLNSLTDDKIKVGSKIFLQ